MPSVPGFFGPSNRQRSYAVDCERAINGFIEVVDAGTPKAQRPWYKRPRLRPYATVAGPVRALFAQDGRAFAVGGQYLYEINPNRTVTQRGSMVFNALPATISSSGTGGRQLFITSGGEGYLLKTTTNVFSNITSPTFPDHAPSGFFMDGFFGALSGVDGRVQLSGLYEGATWSGLDFLLESQFSDQVIQVMRTHDTIVVFGTRNTGVWYNSGNASFPLQPIPSAIIEHGCAGPWTVVRLDNTLYWLGQDELGHGQVWRLQGYTPTRVSTHAVETSFAGIQTFQQAQAFAFQEQGHTFYVLYVPGLDTSWALDIATGEWEEWGHWSTRNGRWYPYLGTTHCFFNGMNLVGDRSGGVIYEQSLTFEGYDRLRTGWAA